MNQRLKPENNGTIAPIGWFSAHHTSVRSYTSSYAGSCAVVHNLGGRRAKSAKRSRSVQILFSPTKNHWLAVLEDGGILYQNNMTHIKKVKEHVPHGGNVNWFNYFKFISIGLCWSHGFQHLKNVPAKSTWSEAILILDYFLTWWSSSSWRLEHQTLYWKRKEHKKDLKQVTKHQAALVCMTG